ncbi:juvenile hormone esterase-like [Amphibalanus amphitrite]|uniref:juvenile hormone esterase-like n=1 Tax=Amphibalanus amphitrite TaxID=1232801 RepID=UPI001C9090F6|nr:juvenile hormone esterase-like [Amphibalanus amphitrite]
MPLCRGNMKPKMLNFLRMVSLLCIAVLLVTSATGCSGQDNGRPLVATREGLIRGAIGRSVAGRLFYSFKGIRYAKPPVGSLRFQPPQRQLAWRGVADGLSHGNVCPQFDMLANNTLKGDEDCLFANVYTPHLPELSRPATAGLPVMVFIHGGGFSTGSGDDDIYGPSYFMDEDVVLVTFNYRLNTFGFFTTHDAAATGNYGLLDQVLLLQWVQDNIAAFGGDPHAVTIFGVSAGGASVSLLVLSPLAKGLFHHAITQSGSALASWALGSRKNSAAENLADLLECPMEDVAAMVECIREQPWEKIAEHTKTLKPGFQYQLRVDREAENPLIPEDPHLLLARGEFNLVPWMSGLTQEEGALFVPLLFSNKQVVEALSKGNLSEWVQAADLITASGVNKLDCGADPMKEAKRVYDFYVGDRGANASDLLPLVQGWADRHLVSPMVAEMTLASQHAPVYKYLLDYSGPGRLSLAHVDLFWPGVPDYGTTHGDDIPYLFSNDKLPLVQRGSPTHTMVRFMVNVWTTFARTGRPGSDLLPMPDWPVFTELHQRHMRLNTAPSVGERLFQERVDFWKTVPINEPWRHPVDTTCLDDSVSEDREQTDGDM